MQYILGVDSGGTKTEALLLRPDGAVAGWGRWDAVEAGSREEGGRSMPAAHAAIRQAIGDTPVSRLTVVSAGFGDALRRLLPPEYTCPRTVRTLCESTPVFCLVDGPALVALAGTGSHVAGQDAAGRQVILDGYGPYIGDYGSAVALGLEGLRAAAKSDWHPRHRTSLATALQQAVRKIDPRAKGNLVAFMYHQPDRWKVAAMARWVDAEAEAGDPIARQIVCQVGCNMADVIFDVLEQLQLRDAALPLIAFGGMTRSRLYWQSLREAVAAFAPGVRPARLCLPPVACLALSALGTRPPDEFAAIRATLRATLAPVLGRDIPEELDYT